MQIPTYDVTGVAFTASISNFCPQNVYAALRSVDITERTSLHAKIPLIIHDRLDCNNELEYVADVLMWGRKFTVTIDTEAKYAGPIVDTLLSNGLGKQVILRTREY